MIQCLIKRCLIINKKLNFNFLEKENEKMDLQAYKNDLEERRSIMTCWSVKSVGKEMKGFLVW